jgi:ferric-dicitrate binding protein FerR (iron transport regulator)
MHDQREQTQTSAVPATPAGRELSSDLPVPLASGSRSGATIRSSRRPFALAISAVLLIAASVATVSYIIASRPVIVGQLTRTTGCRWYADPGNLTPGTLLESGQELNLIEGSALITLGNGTQLFMEGRTTLRLDADSNVHLRFGRLAAQVPTQARGFTVNSSLATFVDLGTAFTLDLVSETSFDLHVFEGLVELRLDERFGNQRPLRVTEVRAVHFDIKSGDVETLHFEEGKQMPF